MNRYWGFNTIQLSIHRSAFEYSYFYCDSCTPQQPHNNNSEFKVRYPTSRMGRPRRRYEINEEKKENKNPLLWNCVAFMCYVKNGPNSFLMFAKCNSAMLYRAEKKYAGKKLCIKKKRKSRTKTTTTKKKWLRLEQRKRSLCVIICLISGHWVVDIQHWPYMLLCAIWEMSENEICIFHVCSALAWTTSVHLFIAIAEKCHKFCLPTNSQTHTHSESSEAIHNNVQCASSSKFTRHGCH